MPELNMWKARANGEISCGSKDRTTNVAQNLLITRAYAKLYIENQTIFKWAGMAAYASDMVGMGITLGKAVDIFADGTLRSAGPPLPPARQNVVNLDNMLIEGNKAVYADVYWQHLAYKDKGLDEVLKQVARLPPRNSRVLKDAWSLIDRGAKKKDVGSVWAGNTLLLRYEQEVTLQSIYDRYPSLAATLSYVMVSPLPGQVAFFRGFGGRGTVGNFADRWRWITEVLMPQWRRLDAGSMLSEVRLIYMGNFPKRLVCLL